jgi:hypothetical protein
MPEIAAAPPSGVAPEPVQPAAERSPTEWMGDTEQDFADMDAGKAPDKSAKPQKPVEKPAEKPVEKPEENTVEEVKAPEKPVEKQQEVKPVKAAELRAAYDGLKKRVKEEYEPQLQSLKAKIQEFESKKPEDTAPVIAKLKSLEERNAALEKQIAYVDYQESTDFKDKYANPYKEAWTEAVAEFRELNVRLPDGEDDMGNPKFKVRPADENDLLQLANMKLSDMDDTAQKMFGASYSRAIGHIQNLKKLSAAQSKALEEAKTKATEWKSQRNMEFQNQAKNMANTWTETNKSLQEKFPKAFNVEEGNADDKVGHTKGFALADLMFLGGQSLTPEQVEALPTGFREKVKANQPLSETQKVQLHALARLKMANHDRKVIALKKANERIAELEKSLADYEKSEPKAGKAGSGATVGGKDWMETAEDELRALDK